MSDLRMLCERLGLRRDPAYDPVWSAAPDFLGLIADHVLAQTPGTIVECSSGASTLILARCCELNGQGKVFSLENSALYANKTRSELAACGLEQYAEIIHAPLVQQSIDGSQYQWYDLKNFTASRIDMLVIDGPPGFVQRHARFPALPLLFDRLADGGKVYLDDAARVDEQEIVSMWRTQFSSVEHEYAATERGCAILRIRR